MQNKHTKAGPLSAHQRTTISMAFRCWAYSGPRPYASGVPFKVAYFAETRLTTYEPDLVFVIATPFFLERFFKVFTMHCRTTNEGRGKPCLNTRADLGLGRRRNILPPEEPCYNALS